MTVLLTIDDLTPMWLTGALNAAGVLNQGQVIQVEVSRTTHHSSLNYFLKVKYSTDAPKSAPATLFLKLSRPERLPLTDDEVGYYTRILAQMPSKITPACYAAEYDSAKGAYHILMEDVSGTHGMLPYQVPPQPEQALQMGRTLARLHAFWWEKPNLQTVNHLPSEAVIRRYVDTCLPGLAAMLDYLGDRLTVPQKSQLEHLVETYPRWMLARTQQTPNHLTLIHGDAHNGNFLLPHTSGEAFLIDRQSFDWSLTCWLGVSDLTYMMIHWWYPAYRQRVEESVLRAYHAQLRLHGVEHYAWQQLWDDYRLCAIQSLFVPLAWCALETAGKSASAWYPQLMFTLDALAQLGSAELLDQVV